MVSGIPQIQVGHEGVCQGCASGKNVKGPFPSSSGKSKEILQLIHSNICGSMSETSLGGYLYYVIFVDDFSHKTWIFYLKTKDQTFSMFTDFKTLAENQTRKKIKILRIDNGGEYTSNDFKDFCKDVGIKREVTIPYNHQQNGVVERKNKTILEVAKAMIHDQNLPMFLWGEVTNIAIYVQNRSPHQASRDKTPEEVFTSVKLEVGHSRIFGCPI